MGRARTSAAQQHSGCSLAESTARTGFSRFQAGWASGGRVGLDELGMHLDDGD